MQRSFLSLSTGEESSCIRSFILKGPTINTFNVYSNPIIVYVYREQGENAGTTYPREHFVSITHYKVVFVIKLYLNKIYVYYEIIHLHN